MENKLFSIVLLHYKQEAYLAQALRSILCQDYPAIEILVADDGTPHFDVPAIRKIVEAERRENIVRFEVLTASENIGTVARLNQALMQTTGDYILFFAADDTLYDQHVLTLFAQQLKTLSPDALCVSAQCLMMDEQLKERRPDFTRTALLLALNACDAHRQFLAQLREPIYSTGASAFPRSALFRNGAPFDPTYRLIEDWPFFLARTRAGEKVFYVDFPALCHRAGGVSTSVNSDLSLQRLYDTDQLNILEREILPYIRELPLSQQDQVMVRYENDRGNFNSRHGIWYGLSLLQLVLRHPKLYLRRWVLRRYASVQNSLRQRGAALLALWCAWLLTVVFLMLSTSYPTAPVLPLIGVANILSGCVFPLFMGWQLFHCAVDAAIFVFIALRRTFSSPKKNS